MRQNFFEKHYGNDRAAKVVYGTVLIFAFLIAQHAHGVNNGLQLTFSTLAASLTVVFAEIYAEILGKTINQKAPLSKTQRHEIKEDSFAILGVSVWPAALFLLTYAGFFAIDVAFLLAYIYCLSMLFLFSYWASRLSGFSKRTSLSRGTLIVIIGIGVVAVKYLLGGY